MCKNLWLHSVDVEKLALVDPGCCIDFIHGQLKVAEDQLEAQSQSE